MITITFTPETPEQLAAVTAAMQAYLGAPVQEDTVAEADHAAKRHAAPAKKRRAAPTEAPVAEPYEPEAPVAPTASAPVPEVSLEQVRAKLVVISQAGKGPAVAALLSAKYGVKNLTAVPQDQLAALLADAEAL